MVDESFYRLPEDKQKRVIQVCINEFTEHGYRNASTNRMVKKIGISKGSLFNYFGSKEDLYLHLLHIAGKEMLKELEPSYADMPDDLFDRLRRVTNSTFDFYIKNPILYRFFMSFTDSATSFLTQKYIAMFSGDEIQKIFYNMFQGVDTKRFRFDEETTFMLIQWLFSGLKQELSGEINPDTDPVQLKKNLMGKLDIVIEALKVGVYIEDQ